MHILNDHVGVVKIEEKSMIGKIFCKHEVIEGQSCSSIGMTRISGIDRVKVCKKCGKIFEKTSMNYD